MANETQDDGAKRYRSLEEFDQANFPKSAGKLETPDTAPPRIGARLIRDSLAVPHSQTALTTHEKAKMRK